MSTAQQEVAATTELTEFGWIFVVAGCNFLACLILTQLGVPLEWQYLALPLGTILVAAKTHGVE